MKKHCFIRHSVQCDKSRLQNFLKSFDLTLGETDFMYRIIECSLRLNECFHHCVLNVMLRNVTLLKFQVRAYILVRLILAADADIT